MTYERWQLKFQQSPAGFSLVGGIAPKKRKLLGASAIPEYVKAYVLGASLAKRAEELASYSGDDVQYMDGYFEGLHSHMTPEGNKANVDDYVGFLTGALKVILPATGEPNPFDAPVPAPAPAPIVLPVLARGDVVPDGDLRLRILRLGMAGPLVRLWRHFLGLSASANFDLEAESATKEWQAKQGLPADGVVGVLSWSRILT